MFNLYKIFHRFKKWDNNISHILFKKKKKKNNYDYNILVFYYISSYQKVQGTN